MSTIVVDTDVASALIRHRLSPFLAGQLAGHTVAVTFVTVGELTKWALIRRWGWKRTASVEAFLARALVLPYDEGVARTWGELQAYAHQRGRPRPINDSWIAACCLARGLPLATLNVKDFADFSEHEGLQLVTET